MERATSKFRHVMHLRCTSDAIWLAEKLCAVSAKVARDCRIVGQYYMEEVFDRVLRVQGNMLTNETGSHVHELQSASRSKNFAKGLLTFEHVFRVERRICGVVYKNMFYSYMLITWCEPMKIYMRFSILCNPRMVKHFAIDHFSVADPGGASSLRHSTWFILKEIRGSVSLAGTVIEGP